MSNSEKILKSLSSLIENGILTSKDIKKKYLLILNLKKIKSLINLSLYLEEFEVLKKLFKNKKQL